MLSNIHVDVRSDWSDGEQKEEKEEELDKGGVADSKHSKVLQLHTDITYQLYVYA